MAQHKGSLGGGVFSIREVEYLESLPAVDRVRSGRIVYNDAFKRDCIRRYRNGESPAEIFRSAGLDSALIGYKRIERSIARWKAALGDDGAPAHGPLALHRCNRQPLEPVAAPSSQFRVRPSGPSLPVCRRHCRHRVHRPVRIAAAERARAGPAQPHHRPAGPPHPGTRNRNQRTETRAPRRGRKRYRGGGILSCPVPIPRQRRGYRGILAWRKPSDGWHYACSRRTTATSRHIRGKRGATRRNTFGLEGAVCAAHITGGTPTSGGARRMIAVTSPR